MTTTESLLQDDSSSSLPSPSDTAAAAAAGLLPGRGINGPMLSDVTETTSESIADDEATMLDMMQKSRRLMHYNTTTFITQWINEH